MSSVSPCEDVGEFFHVSGGYWRTPNLTSLQVGSVYSSPKFESIGNLWQLSLSPKCFDINVDLRFEIRLDHLQGTFSAEKIRIGIVGNDGEYLTNEECYPPYIFPLLHYSKIRFPVIGKTSYDGYLRIFIKINSKEKSQAESFDQSKRKFNKENSYQTDKNASFEASIRMDDEIGMLERTLTNMNMNEKVLKRKDQGVKCPRCALAAGSPVFNAMVIKETRKDNNNDLDFRDIRISTFLDFLSYLQTENIEKVQKNVLEFYKIADKFKVYELREFCKERILKDISIENFCDVLVLSLGSGDIEMTDACALFFAQNVYDVVLSAKWKTFIKNHRKECEKLHIKRLEINELLEKTMV